MLKTCCSFLLFLLMTTASYAGSYERNSKANPTHKIGVDSHKTFFGSQKVMETVIRSSPLFFSISGTKLPTQNGKFILAAYDENESLEPSEKKNLEGKLFPHNWEKDIPKHTLALKENLKTISDYAQKAYGIDEYAELMARQTATMSGFKIVDQDFKFTPQNIENYITANMAPVGITQLSKWWAKTLNISPQAVDLANKMLISSCIRADMVEAFSKENDTVTMPNAGLHNLILRCTHIQKSNLEKLFEN